MIEDGYGLVLSGGGTKGAYEIGAWKALQEMEIPLRGIVGTSIGAINAALFFQDDFSKAERIYREIQMDDVIEISESIDPEQSLLGPGNVKSLMKEWIQQKGLSNSPLRKMVELNIDVDKLYNSEMDFGMMTFSVDSLGPQPVFKEDIPRDEMVNYILASANFPIYKPQKADGKRFLDGGLYDNMPINMLVDRGYRRIIVIDISGTGLTRKLNNPNEIYVKKIRCTESLGGTFDFDQDRITKNIQMGYLDTLKAFQRIHGHRYYFETKYFNSLLERFNLDHIYGFETAAKMYGIERYQVYEDDLFLTALLEKHLAQREEFRRINDTGLVTKILKSPLLITKLVDSGMAVVVFEEMLQAWPGQDFSRIQRFFPGYMLAAYAMIELQNYFELRHL